MTKHEVTQFYSDWEVHIKIFPEGFVYWKHYNEEILKDGSNIPLEDYEKRKDERGYTYLKVSELLTVFGHTLVNGKPTLYEDVYFIYSPPEVCKTTSVRLNF